MALKKVPFCPLEQQSSPVMPRGRPRKKPRNICGLRGQHHTTPLVSAALLTTSEDEYHKPCAQGAGSQSDSESDEASMVIPDGLKIDFRLEYEGQHEDDVGTHISMGA
jgi:hypothetical protein